MESAQIREEKISRAIDALLERRFDNAAAAADHFGVAPSTLRHRVNGRPSVTETHSPVANLSRDQERVLAQWIRDLQTQAIPPSHEIIEKMANQILALNSDMLGVGDHWTTRFVQRHELSTGRSKPSDLARLISLTYGMIDQLFDAFLALMEQYNIQPEDVWNMDEKGFQMGRHGRSLVVFDKTQGSPASASTRTTNWVSIIEYINSTGLSVNPFIIHIGKKVKSGWFLPNAELPDWHWSFSASRWTNNQLGVIWLRDWFIPRTGRDGRHRLLMQDGHESHESDEFAGIATAANIHQFFIPPYSSGLL